MFFNGVLLRPYSFMATYGSFPKIRGPQYRPTNTIILIMGTHNKVPPILGNSHISNVHLHSWDLGYLGPYTLLPINSIKHVEFGKTASELRI